MPVLGARVSGVVKPNVQRVLGTYKLSAFPKVLRRDGAARLARHLFGVGVLKLLVSGGIDLSKTPLESPL